MNVRGLVGVGAVKCVSITTFALPNKYSIVAFIRESAGMRERTGMWNKRAGRLLEKCIGSWLCAVVELSYTSKVLQ